MKKTKCGSVLFFTTQKRFKMFFQYVYNNLTLYSVVLSSRCYHFNFLIYICGYYSGMVLMMQKCFYFPLFILKQQASILHNQIHRVYARQVVACDDSNCMEACKENGIANCVTFDSNLGPNDLIKGDYLMFLLLLNGN